MNKKMRCMAWLAVAVLAVGSASQAALLVYEGFDYPTGDLGGKNGGTGWAGSWSGGDNYSVVAESLSMSNLPFATTGGSIIGQSNANRNFSDGIDFSQEGVRYASFIAKRTGWGATDGGGEWFDFHFRTTGYTDAAMAGISSDEKFEARVSTTSVTKAGSAATTNPYFLVTKIVTHPTAADEIYLKAYSESDTVDLAEPTGWTVVGTTSDIDLLAGMVTLWAGSDDDGDGLYQAAVDEIRVGETWNDVIPEPGTMGLVVICSAGLIAIRRLMI